MSLKWKSDKVLQADFRKLIKIVQHPRRAMQKIGTWFIKASTQNIQSEGRRIGEHWQPLSEKYKKVRYAKGYTGGMLQKTGALLGSLTYNIPSDAKLQWSYGSTASYGMYHISQSKRTKIPYRQFIGIAKADKQMIIKILSKETKTDIRRLHLGKT